MKLLIVIFLVAVGFVHQAFAAQNNYLHKPYFGVRAIGAANAFTAIHDDYLAMFYNPAGMAKLEKGQLNFGFRGMMTSSAIKTVNDIQDSMKATGGSSDPSRIIDTVNRYLGTHEATRIGLDAVWARPNWGIAFVPIDASVELDIRGGGPTIGALAYQDTALQFSYGKNFGEKDSLALGASVKTVYRGFLDKDLTPLDLIGSQNIVRMSDAKEGITFDADVGSLYTVQIEEDKWWSFLKYAKPTFGLVVRNVLDMGFQQNLHLYGKDTGNNPAKLERRFDLGSRWDLPEFWVFKPRVMIDGREMGSRYASFKKSLAIGTELLWRVGSSLHGGYRMGIHQGYLSAGVSATLWIFQLDLATYSEEIGTTDSPRESRRYIAKASLDF